MNLVQVLGGVLIAAGILARPAPRSRLARGVTPRTAVRCHDDPAAAHRARLGRRGRGADGDQARHGPREQQPRARLGGAALGHRPRRRAAHVLRDRRRRAARRHVASRTGTARRSTSPRSPRRGSSLLVSLAVGALAVARLAGWIEIETSTAWWMFAAVVLVIAIDVSRTTVSLRGRARVLEPGALVERAPLRQRPRRDARRPRRASSPSRAGWPAGDSLAALFVAFLVVTAASRLIRRNVDVLMDRAPADAVLRRAGGDRGRSSRPWRCAGCGSARRRAARSPTSSSASRPAPPSARATPSPTASRRRWSARCRAATSSSTSSRPGRSRPCASGSARRRCRSRACARSTTSSVIELERRLPRHAPSQAARRPPARRGARDRRAGRARDRRRRSRGGRRPEPPRAALRAGRRPRGATTTRP